MEKLEFPKEELGVLRNDYIFDHTLLETEESYNYRVVCKNIFKNFSFESAKKHESEEFVLNLKSDVLKWKLIVSLNPSDHPDLKLEIKFNDVTGFHCFSWEACLVDLNLKENSFDQILDEKTKFQTLNHIWDIQEDLLHSTNDSLIISCNITFKISQNLENSNIVREEVLINIEDLGKYSDIVLKMGDRSLKAHKVMLSLKSSYFRLMLNESTDDIEITDTTYEIMKLLLKYIYTEVIPDLNYEDLKEILVAASKYEVKELKEKLEHILLSEVSLENCVELVILADKLNANFLLESTMNFILRNIKNIEQSKLDQFQESNTKLLTEILKRLIVILKN